MIGLFRTLIKWILFMFFVAALAYGGMLLYDYAVEEAANRIKRKVRQGIVGVFNPLSWPKRLVGGLRGDGN